MLSSLTLQPIGILRTTHRVKFHAGHQPVEESDQTNLLELQPGLGYEQALRDLAGFERVWLIWWFHQNTTWRPLVLPPRGPAQRRGVFATRSPHRPNPLGLTSARLLKIEGLRLTLGPCDLVDGTPVLDLKPYISSYDSFEGQAAGWIDGVDEEMRRPPRFQVVLSPAADEQLSWLKANWRVDFLERLTQLLARDPSPHRTRRIKRVQEDRFRISCGAWRANFSVHGETVQVFALEPGYPLRFLTREGYDEIPDRDAQLAFLERWPLPIKDASSA